MTNGVFAGRSFLSNVNADPLTGYNTIKAASHLLQSGR